MSLDSATRERIETLLNEHRVVLFMKGNRSQPMCGFSASATNVLNELLPDYHTVDVLQDAEIREGIKTYGQWPTIPQLYVEGELVGGADIIRQMYGSGELHALFGATPPDRTPPEITITEKAAEAIRGSHSKISRMELGRVSFKERDVTDLLEVLRRSVDRAQASRSGPASKAASTGKKAAAKKTAAAPKTTSKQTATATKNGTSKASKDKANSARKTTADKASTARKSTADTSSGGKSTTDKATSGGTTTARKTSSGGKSTTKKATAAKQKATAKKSSAA